MSTTNHTDPLRTEFSHHWALDPSLIFLNHGSFGACPRPVLAAQQRFRDRMEQSLWKFLILDLEPLMDAARLTLARFVGADPEELVFLSNATTAVNTVLHSLWANGTLAPGVEILTTNHTYNSCREALDYVVQKSGAAIVLADIPFPLHSADQIDDAILSAVTPRTRLALLDHVTSPTAMIFARQPLIAQLKQRGVETLIDGAHAPGSLPLNLTDYGATYYVGNCHKWLCGPKSAAFLQVQRDRQQIIRPLVIGSRASLKRPDRPRFRLEFDWMGTGDYTAILSIPAVIDFMGSLLPGGWPQLMQRNHDLAVAARRLICTQWNVEPPCPDDMLTSMFSLPLPDGSPRNLQVAILEKHHMEAQIMPWPNSPKRLFRGSAQLYNNLAQYQLLANAIPACLAEE